MGSPITSVDATTIGADHGFASRVLRVRWSTPGQSGHLVVKLWSTAEVPGPGEAGFYRTFAEASGDRVPVCYFAETDPDAGRGVVVLEDLSRLEQGDCLERLTTNRARSLARCLADLHGAWWDDPLIRSTEWLPTTPPAREGAWFADRRSRFLARFASRLDGFTGPLLDRIEAPYAAASDRLSNGPQTLLHRDLHLDNVLIDPTDDEVVLLDWAMISRGHAAIDLTQLLFVIGQDADLEVLLTTYLHRLHGHGVAMTRDGLEEMLVAGVIVLFVTWTCAIARWEPRTSRERRIIDVGVERALRAVRAWRGPVLRFAERAKP